MKKITEIPATVVRIEARQRTFGKVEAEIKSTRLDTGESIDFLVPASVPIPELGARLRVTVELLEEGDE